MLKLAEIKPSDAFYDLGCCDGSILILAVKEFNVKEAIGIESHPLRYRKAKCNGKKQKLSNRITAAEVNYVINQLKAVGVSRWSRYIRFIARNGRDNQDCMYATIKQTRPNS
jgi:cyclopropane fatty-acyl-phospholipid synthase-like methyltransferase